MNLNERYLSNLGTPQLWDVKTRDCRVLMKGFKECYHYASIYYLVGNAEKYWQELCTVNQKKKKKITNSPTA